MARIWIRQTGKSISCQEGANLLDALLEGGAFVDNPCSGKGICGKCKVRICQGELPAMSETEQALLKPEEIEAGIRLSCMIDVNGTMEVELLKKEIGIDEDTVTKRIREAWEQK